jgi:uncharacterized protein (TIGR02246 family)
MRSALALFFAVLIAGCQAMSSSTEASRAEVAQATERWATNFNGSDGAVSVSLYDPEAVLWGTLSPVIISTPAGVRQYFDRAFSAPSPPKVTLGEQAVRVYGDMAINSGTYTFTVVIGGQPRTLPARFSFTYRRKDGGWLIVDHHSSALPTPPSPPAGQ